MNDRYHRPYTLLVNAAMAIPGWPMINPDAATQAIHKACVALQANRPNEARPHIGDAYQAALTAGYDAAVRDRIIDAAAALPQARDRVLTAFGI